MKKRLLALALCLVMLIGLVPTAFADGQGLVGVVEVNDFAVGAVGLFAAQIAHRSVHNFLPEFFFSH